MTRCALPHKKSLEYITLSICARASKLSLIQVQEVLINLRQYYPNIAFQLTTSLTPGDKDTTTSLTSCLVTDFFTKNLDEDLIREQHHIAVHSAKDVPFPLIPELELLAITKSISEIDVLLFADKNLANLSRVPLIIGTSSLRRMHTIQKLFPFWKIKDIRGTIDTRINLIHKKIVHGIVVAKAALIRLNLLNKYTIIELPPPYAELQGSLAILGKKNAFPFLKTIFSTIHEKSYESFLPRS